MARGSLTVVGTGIALASQCTPEARQHIESADIVFEVVGQAVAQQWLRRLNRNIVSLQRHYGPNRSRAQTYDAMTDEILAAVRSEQNVCAAFYGHPGVFVWPSHDAVRRARAEGFEARMLPGVSAEDCLVADLGVDPARHGWQSYEATDFLIYAPRFDTTASLVLWQIGVVGDRSLRELTIGPGRLMVLTQVLMEHYPADHFVTVYEAATLPMTAPRIERVALERLPRVTISQQSTLLVPPFGRRKPDPSRIALLQSVCGSG